MHGPADPDHRLPGVLNVELPGCSADALLLLLDAAGIDCSTGSACTAGVAEPSHVLLALGRTEFVRPVPRSGSRWATRPPRPTSTPWRPPCPRCSAGPGPSAR